VTDHEQLDLLTGTDEDPAREVVDRARELFAALDDLPEEQRIDAVNAIRLALAEHSPMRDEPVDCVLWVKSEAVTANDYNPNVVAPPEMELLKLSILADGYTQPIVGWRTPADDGAETYEIVDGFHRHRVGKEARAVSDRIHGRLPLAVIRPDREGSADRMAATIRHNRARGEHTVKDMSAMVVYLRQTGKSPEWISEHLGMPADEVQRLQVTHSLGAAFADQDFSQAWEPDHDSDLTFSADDELEL
jgi:ParB-like chromosome segregation protein Spo0J